MAWLCYRQFRSIYHASRDVGRRTAAKVSDYQVSCPSDWRLDQPTCRSEPSAHTSIHHWWFDSRDYKPGVTDIDMFLFEASTQAYYEDGEAFEWIMDVVRNDADPQIDLSFARTSPA